MKQIKNNRVKNRSLTNLHKKQLPFAKLFTEKGIIDFSDAISAENGITYADFKIKLGGDLTEHTEIGNPDSKNLQVEGEFMDLMMLNKPETSNDPFITGFTSMANFPIVPIIGVVKEQTSGERQFIFGELNVDTGGGSLIQVMPDSNAGHTNNGLISLQAESLVKTIALDQNMMYVGDDLQNPTSVAVLSLDSPTSSNGSEYTINGTVQEVGVQMHSQFFFGETGLNISKYYGGTSSNDYFGNRIYMDDSTINIQHNSGFGANSGANTEVVVDANGLTITDNTTNNPTIIPFGGFAGYIDTATAAADGSLLKGTPFRVTNGDGTSALHIKD